jgi:hypothetical protein
MLLHISVMLGTGFFLLIICVLLSPLRICIDSSKGVSRLTWIRCISLSIVQEEGMILLNWKVFIRRGVKILYPFSRGTEEDFVTDGRPSDKTETEGDTQGKGLFRRKEKAMSGGKSPGNRLKTFNALAFEIYRLVKDIFRSFNVRKCRVDLSTDDPAVNGMITGAVHALGIEQDVLSVNFEGYNYMYCDLSARPVRILACFAKFISRRKVIRYVFSQLKSRRARPV